MQHNAVFPVRCAVALAATLVLGACGGGPSVASGTDPIPAGTTVASTPPPPRKKPPNRQRLRLQQSSLKTNLKPRIKTNKPKAACDISVSLLAPDV